MGVRVPLEATDETILEDVKVVLEPADETLLIALFAGGSFTDSSRLRFLGHGPISLAGVLTAEDDDIVVEGSIAGIDRGWTRPLLVGDI